VSSDALARHLMFGERRWLHGWTGSYDEAIKMMTHDASGERSRSDHVNKLQVLMSLLTGDVWT
jgi:hypothetical protein